MLVFINGQWEEIDQEQLVEVEKEKANGEYRD